MSSNNPFKSWLTFGAVSELSSFGTELPNTDCARSTDLTLALLEHGVLAKIGQNVVMCDFSVRSFLYGYSSWLCISTTLGSQRNSSPWLLWHSLSLGLLSMAESASLHLPMEFCDGWIHSHCYWTHYVGLKYSHRRLLNKSVHMQVHIHGLV